MMHLVGGTEAHARCTCGHTWTPGQKPVYVVTRAETAECTCPDVCERDHANDYETGGSGSTTVPASGPGTVALGPRRSEGS